MNKWNTLRDLLIMILVIIPLTRTSAQELKDVFTDGRGETYFRFVAPVEIQRRAAGIVSIDNIVRDTVYAYANIREFSDFLLLGYDFEVLTAPAMLNYPARMTDSLGTKGTWDSYPTYPAYLNMMAAFEQQYPSLCRLHDLGTLPSGRKILALRITDNPDSLEAEPEFLYTSSMHGDELVGYVLMLRLADHLLSNYGSDPVATRIIDSVDLWINPLANPDGAYRTGNYSVSGATRYNANWVDLNRNYPDPQDGPHPDGNAWQPETVIFMNFASQHNFRMSSNIHGGAEVCNYPWDTWPRLTADDNWWTYVCNEYADTAQHYSPNGYMDDFGTGVTNGYAWYTTNGNRQDHMNYFHYCREFTLELSNQKLPNALLLPSYWNYNYRSLINYIEQSLNGLQGLVTDSLSGSPLRAKVFIAGHDQDSSFVYSVLPTGHYNRYLPTGNYDITFSAPGYHEKTITGIQIIQGNPENLDVQLMPDVIKVAGKLFYDDTASTLMANALILLSDTMGNVLDSSRTDSAGAFVFLLEDTGSYHLSVIPGIPWGGVNSTDALLVAQHFAQIGTPLSGLAYLAGDVNMSDFLNATDALKILRRFVGLDNIFAAGDWVGNEVELKLSGDITLSVKILCTGDTDRSYSL